jgi:protein gp37
MNSTNIDGTYTWNPWTGCKKCGPGCTYCRASSTIKISSTEFKRPIQAMYMPGVKACDKPYKIPSGSIIKVCTTSDFFIDALEKVKQEAIEEIEARKDCLFIITTRRPENIDKYFESYTEKELRNIVINVAVEDNERAWEKIPILLNINSPIKYRGISISPMIEPLDLSPFLSSGLISRVELNGESYRGWSGVPHELNIDWVKYISNQCKEYEVAFKFKATGTRIIVNNKKEYIRQSKDEIELAKFYNLDYEPINSETWEQIADKLPGLDTKERAARLQALILEKYKQDLE